jgi:flagellar hook-length control protein FliK
VSERLRLITEYRAGLEAEIALLRHLATLAENEREVTASKRVEALGDITEARDQVMAALVSLEAGLRPIRHALREPGELVHLQEFRELAALHREAATLAEEILATDAHSLAALRDAEQARRFAAESLEKAESTLAAYRRVVMLSFASATLLNRRG